MCIISLNKISTIKVLRLPTKTDKRFIGYIYFDKVNPDTSVAINDETVLILDDGKLQNLYDFLVIAYSKLVPELNVEFLD